MPTEEEIRENLHDAGCGLGEIRAILDSLRRGDEKGAEQLMQGCRKKELARLHACQRRIDRLDYLRYRLQNER